MSVQLEDRDQPSSTDSDSDDEEYVPEAEGMKVLMGAGIPIIAHLLCGCCIELSSESSLSEEEGYSVNKDEISVRHSSRHSSRHNKLGQSSRSDPT